MLIRNSKKCGASVVTSAGEILFDENGMAEVSEDLAQCLVCLKGYEFITERPHMGMNESDKGTQEETENETQLQLPQNGTEESGATSIPPQNIDSMKLEQLKQYAKENNIDIKGATRKPDMLAIIKECMQT